MRIYLLIFLLAFSLLHAVINDYEMAAIEEMMNSVGLVLEDVNFAKNWSPSAFTIPLMLTCLEEPWAFPEFVADIKVEILKKEFVNFYNYVTNIVYESYSPLAPISDWQPPTIKKPLDILKYAEKIFEQSETHLNKSFVNLTTDEIEYLRRFLYSNVVGGSEDSESYEFIAEIIDLPEVENYQEFYIDLINKIDFASLVISAKIFYTGMEYLYQQDFSHFSYRKPVRYKSKFGLMIVGTTANDVYPQDENYAFIYEPAGNDTYTFNISTDIGRPFLAIIDMSGDDVYRNDNFGELFNALFGNIFHYDGGGNDYYFGGDLAFSANLGNMISIDNQGWDSYIAGSRSLGSGHLGIGLLINIGGNDYYYGTMFTQGMGGTLGFGGLLDFADGIWNNDCYHSGGKWTDSLRDDNDYYSMAQGFGFGLRPSIAGGIGLLFDESGNDKYNGGVFSQGVSYWYAMGVLIDLEGNDFYNSCWYPQGSGIHLSVGFLYDGSGDDAYFSKRGPGQGAGHDYSVGFFVDRAGNDYYSVDGGNGMGRANSVGVFVESGGNDRYERIGYSNYGSSHHNYEDRSAGNIGIFLDAGGNDVYSDPRASNNSQWVDGVFGIGRDTELQVTSFELQDTSLPVVPISDWNISISEIFSIACHGRASQNTEAKEQILEREEEFVDYFMNNHLHSNDIMIQITMSELVPKLPLLHERLIEGLDKTNHVSIGNSIYYMSLTGNVSFADIFEDLLNDEEFSRYTNSLIQALGRLPSDKSVEIISRYINDESVYRRTVVARALKNLNTEESIAMLYTMADDPDFMIRAMVIRIKN